jgi:hypothetical protein
MRCSLAMPIVAFRDMARASKIHSLERQENGKRLSFGRTGSTAYHEMRCIPHDRVWAT